MLTPCSPCICPSAPCEQCTFGYRDSDTKHNMMKDLIKKYLRGETPYGYRLAERYMEYHPYTWREDVGDYLLENVDKKEYKMKDALLVSIVNDILIVAKKPEGEVPQIINAFQGEEAKALYNKLVTETKNE